MKFWKITTGILLMSQLSLGLAWADAPSIAAIVKPSKGTYGGWIRRTNCNCPGITGQTWKTA